MFSDFTGRLDSISFTSIFSCFVYDLLPPLKQRYRSLHGGSFLLSHHSGPLRKTRDFILQRQFEVMTLSQEPIMFYLMTNTCDFIAQLCDKCVLLQKWTFTNIIHSGTTENCLLKVLVRVNFFSRSCTDMVLFTVKYFIKRQGLVFIWCWFM